MEPLRRFFPALLASATFVYGLGSFFIAGLLIVILDMYAGGVQRPLHRQIIEVVFANIGTAVVFFLLCVLPIIIIGSSFVLGKKNVKQAILLLVLPAFGYVLCFIVLLIEQWAFHPQ